MDMQQYVMIVAGGKGARMQADVPKQFLKLEGKPVLMHTMEAFYNAGSFEFVVVLPSESLRLWKQLCEEHKFSIRHRIAEGGPSRYHSVKSGLKFIPQNSLVAIHDGVRPLLTEAIIHQGFQLAEKKGNAVAVVELKDSLRELSGSFNKAVQRQQFRLVQTPQIFHSNLIKDAYQQMYDEAFTDDAMVVEKMGERIHLFPGSEENIKITRSADMLLAASILRRRV